MTKTTPAPPPLDLDAIRAGVADVLTDNVFACTRVWEAWQCGTMTQDDFTPAWEDDAILDEIVEVLTKRRDAEMEALRTQRGEIDHQLAQHVIALRDMRHERDTYKRALEGKP